MNDHFNAMMDSMRRLRPIDFGFALEGILAGTNGVQK